MKRITLLACAKHYDDMICCCS